MSEQTTASTSQEGTAPASGDAPTDVAERALAATSRVLQDTGGFLVGRDPVPDAPTVIEFVRHARGRGERDTAVRLLESALRDGRRWAWARLWTELVSFMDEPSDFERIRELWLDSPSRIHRSVPVLRSVARAACISGHHDEGRSLLRRAIISQVQGDRRNRLKRAARRRLGPVVRRLRGEERPDVVAFRDSAAEAMRDLNEALDDIGVRSFLLGGTLLGYVRAGDFISWDKDIDVGVFAADFEPGTLEREFATRDRFAVRRVDLTTDRLRVNHVNGTMIDVFPHYEEGDRIWHDGAATRWWNTPFELERVEFVGVPQHIPKDADRYLTESYGDWRTPVAEFEARLDKPNTEVTDPDYLDSLAYFSLLDAIVKGNVLKKRRFTAALRALGEGDWLDRI